MADQNTFTKKQYVILDDIRSAHNVGAIFRTAEGAGVEKMYLCGYTPRPIDRFGREVAEIKKTSLGASEMVDWDGIEDIKELIKRLQEGGVQVVAVELASDAVSLYEFSPASNVAYIFGNEVTGILPEVRALCDVIMQIPMRGQKESLNVATTVGIVTFHNPPNI